MNVAVAYRAKQTETIAAYLKDRETKCEAFDAKVADFKETIGGRELGGIRFFDGGWAINSYQMRSRNEDLLPGWRRDGSSTRAVPAKRTPEGKEVAEQLKRLHLTGNRYPGCPESFSSGNFRVWPYVESIGDAFFLTLTKVPEEGEQMPDPEMWEPVKLSEYHAAHESLEASKALEGSR